MSEINSLLGLIPIDDVDGFENLVKLEGKMRGAERVDLDMSAGSIGVTLLKGDGGLYVGIDLPGMGGRSLNTIFIDANNGSVVSNMGRENVLKVLEDIA